MVLFGESVSILAKVVFFGAKLVVLGESGCIRAKAVLFGQK